MSKSSPKDIAETLEKMVKIRTSSRPKNFGPSWLRHKNKRGYTIDHLLLFGATMEELIQFSDSKNEASVRGHLNHLQTEHHLAVSLDRYGRYIFDINDEDEKPDIGEFEKIKNTASNISPSYWGAVVSEDSERYTAIYGLEAILAEAKEDMTNVQVVLSGPELESIKVALTTIVELLSAHKNPKAWQSGHLANHEQYYVYQHYDNKGVFYIGKGIRTRAFEHIKDAKDAFLSDNDRPKTHKHKRILKLITKGSVLSEAYCDTYKTQHISKFFMPKVRFAEMISFLAEDVLITNQYGVYNLTNETGGNNKSNPYVWLTQPVNSSLFSNGGWANALQYFLKNRRLSSDASAYLKEINANSLIESGKTILHYLAEHISEHTQRPVKIGQDVFIDLAFTHLAFRIQLLFSAKNPTVKLNLRPPRNANGKVGASESTQFRQAIKKVLNTNSALDWKIRIPNDNNCYVKPFLDADNTRTDPAFNILDKESRCNICVVGNEVVYQYNLIEAVQRIHHLFVSSE